MSIRYYVILVAHGILHQGFPNLPLLLRRKQTTPLVLVNFTWPSWFTQRRVDQVSELQQQSIIGRHKARMFYRDFRHSSLRSHYGTQRLSLGRA